LPTASDILRRIQDSIYTPSSFPAHSSVPGSPHTGQDAFAATQTETSISNLPTASTEGEQQQMQISQNSSTGSGRSLLSSTEGLMSLSPPITSSNEPDIPSPRINREMTGRRRQASIPSTSTPDVNAQSVLRKRILEIQQLDIAELEKARLVQVQRRQIMLIYL
jgi:hypothetical protein